MNNLHRFGAAMIVLLALGHCEGAKTNRPDPSNKPTPKQAPETKTVDPKGFDVRTYAVTDLIAPLPSSPSKQNIDWLPDLIMHTVRPDTWKPGQGWISLIKPQGSLVVCQTKEAQEQIVDLLEQLRRGQDESVVINVNFLRMPLGVMPPEESPSKTTGGPTLRWRPVKASDKSPKSSEVQGIELPEINVLNGQTVSFTTPSDAEGGVSHWSVQVVISSDRRSFRLWLGDATGKTSLATAWVSDGEPMTVGLPLEERRKADKPSDGPAIPRAEPMQRWLQLTPQLMVLEEEEERVGDAPQRVAQRPSPKNGSLDVTKASIGSQDFR
ncbi:MAG: hypothetical protein ABFC77_01665 [Thermoguttaceae bacterium]